MEYIERNHYFDIFMNVLGLIGLCIVLLMTFYYQLTNPAPPVLPCSLCLLQRLGFIIAGCGFLFNIFQRVKNIHYSMVILGCIATGLSAAKQIFLQITLGNLGNGPTLFGLRLFIWAFVIAILYVVAVTFIMILNKSAYKFKKFTLFPLLNKMAGFLFVFLIAANLLTVIFECGSGLCPVIL
ncbi:disulfide bond formation protein DsbB [Bartonella callosciuri]|uniref:Disulfide bond formation protein DsbB n=1 Tax=Bartonella callosciuri TaxID=686223 RepID=A0A840P1Z9_9HYPH|nr:disulfide bond formation protein DsbB [Bartonella callosciuri]